VGKKIGEVDPLTKVDPLTMSVIDECVIMIGSAIVTAEDKCPSIARLMEIADEAKKEVITILEGLGVDTLFDKAKKKEFVLRAHKRCVEIIEPPSPEANPEAKPEENDEPADADATPLSTDKDPDVHIPDIGGEGG
jgi:hypothetical protein